MNTRKKKMAAAKKGITYSSAASAAATSGLDCLGILVSIPGWIKWAVVACIGLIAGCVGCCTASPDVEEEERKEAVIERERKEEVEERHRLIQMSQDMLHDMAEMKQELEYHRVEESGNDTRIQNASKRLDKWLALKNALKKQREAKLSDAGIGLFAPEQKPLLEEVDQDVVFHV